MIHPWSCNHRFLCGVIAHHVLAAWQSLPRYPPCPFRALGSEIYQSVERNGNVLKAKKNLALLRVPDTTGTTGTPGIPSIWKNARCTTSVDRIPG
ncbi:hypothetical protein GE21DRAFT_1134696 [Neurospora crassa]|nr:hypothetical protein GE21DRAFT_1134696 [Neurospora crassa]